MGDSGDTGCTDTGHIGHNMHGLRFGHDLGYNMHGLGYNMHGPDTTYTAPDTTYTDTAGHSNPDPINPFDPTYIGPHYGIHDPGYHTRMMDEIGRHIPTMYDNIVPPTTSTVVTVSRRAVAKNSALDTCTRPRPDTSKPPRIPAAKKSHFDPSKLSKQAALTHILGVQHHGH
ncbi:unnamed protein product [Bemisia tabaci]|uniref:Uncharacterized protein n=1 Tax=Bemisia tabaci TaxID=7038 RepID=A0A9P0AND2_BEMTA|nr:unnamed protein product [Bemisia tabaci]